MNPKSLVTGGAGFIGAHVVNELVALGHDVWVIDDLSGGFIENINPKAKFLKGSITDSKFIERVFSENKFGRRCFKCCCFTFVVAGS